MKFIFLTCLATYALADVSHIVDTNEKTANIRRQELDLSSDGSYRWGFETDNGIQAAATGELFKIDDENEAIRVQGEAAWNSPDGVPISFKYIADENGFQPQGAHLPTPPPIPELIRRGLQYIVDHPPKSTVDV